MSGKLVSLIAATAITIAAPLAWSASPLPHKTLTAFASEEELANLLKAWAKQYMRSPSTAYKDQAIRNREIQATEFRLARAAEESDTNIQHAGVDEGGIVKLHGDHLVILRRGRLFTVGIRDRELRPVSQADAFGGTEDQDLTWYDQMLISGNTIVVIGHSYKRNGTEIGLFDINSSGQLAYRATYQLRSNEYYSSRNYVGRLIGSKLVFYTPLYLNSRGKDPYAQFPALRRWRHGVTPDEFKRIAPATRIYRSDALLDPSRGVALHTVTSCDLAKIELDCQSIAVLGPVGRVFYVSASNVFIWTTARQPYDQTPAPGRAVFRLPLDSSAPSVLQTMGSPIDQFSFLESDDGHLNVLLRHHGSGEGGWADEAGSGDLSLLRVPLASFSDGRESAPAKRYRSLPRPASNVVHNRFVGPYLLYGDGTGLHQPLVTHPLVYAVRYADSSQATEIPVTHAVERIEALARNAVVVGSDGRDLHFTSLLLARKPVAIDRYTRPFAAQGETRSHGFFYKAESEQHGLLGLPIVGLLQDSQRHLRGESASLLYLRHQGLIFRELGTLNSRPAGKDDGCRASCLDWYGNSRPLFLRKRVFALLGYEIVEGRIDADKIVETRRISFAPQAAHK